MTYLHMKYQMNCKINVLSLRNVSIWKNIINVLFIKERIVSRLP